MNKNNMISTLQKFNLSNSANIKPHTNKNNLDSVYSYTSLNNSFNKNSMIKIPNIEPQNSNFRSYSTRINSSSNIDKNELYHSYNSNAMQNINRKNLKESFSEAYYAQKERQQQIINNKNVGTNKINKISKIVMNKNNINRNISYGLNEIEDEKKINNFYSNPVMNNISKYTFATKNNFQNFIFDYTDEYNGVNNNNPRNFIRNISHIKLIPSKIDSDNSNTNSDKKEIKGRINNYVLSRTKVNNNFRNIHN